MSDFETSPPKDIEIDADGEGGERIINKSPSPEHEPETAKTNGDDHKSHSKSKSRSKSQSRSHSRSRSRSRHRHKKSKRRRSRTRSHSRSRSRSRSRSHSRSHRRRHRHSRSRSRGRRDRDYDDDDDYHHRRDSRSPMSSRKRHLGDRDHPEPNRCLGVFGLSLYTQERNLRELFGRYGPLNEVQIVYDRQTGRSRGFGFVYFKSSDDAYEAKDRCNGQEVDGRKIRVDFSITERAHTPTPGIYLGRSSDSWSSHRSPSRKHSSSSRRSRSPCGYSYHRSPSRSRSRSTSRI